MRSASLGLGAAVALAAGVLGVAVAAVADSSSAVFVALVALMAAATLGAVVYAVRVEHDAFSPLALAAVFYFLVFCVGAAYFFWWPPPESRFSLLVGRDHLADGVALGLLGWLCFVAGYVAVPLRRRGLAAERRAVELPRVRLVALALIAIGWLARAELVDAGRYFHTASPGAEVATGSAWLIATLAALPLLGIALLFADGELRAGARARSRRLLAWALVAVEAAWSIPTGTRASLVALLLVIVVVRYYGTGGRIPRRLVAAITVLVAFGLLPFGLLYRGTDTAYQLAPRDALAQSVREMRARDVEETVEAGLYATFSRFSPSSSVAVVAARPEARPPVSGWQTISWIPSGFVPRALVPDKADPGRFGNEFGRAYSVIRPNDYTTSISVPHVAELHLLGGVLAVVVGMTLIGGAYRLLGAALARRTVDPRPLALWAVLTWHLVQSHGTILAVGLVGTVKMLLVDAVLLYGLFFLLGVSRATRRVVPARSVTT